MYYVMIQNTAELIKSILDEDYGQFHQRDSRIDTKSSKNVVC